MDPPGFEVKARNAVLTQVLARPVLIGWDDKRTGQYQHLGAVSGADGDRAKLTLWLGHDVACERRILIVFHLPFKPRTSKQMNLKHLYVVVPVEGLWVDVSNVSVERIPRATLQQLRRGSLEQAEMFVHARFTLRKSAYVVMPVASRKMQKSLDDAPLQILLHLQALTEVLRFDLYLEHGPAYDTLQELAANLQRGEVESLDLDLETLYGRGTTGGKNVWEQYPRRNGQDNTIRWNPVLDEAPPQYDQAVDTSSPKRHPLPPDLLPLDFQSSRSRSPSDAASEGTKLIWRITPQPRAEGPLFRDACPSMNLVPMHGRKRKAEEALSEDNIEVDDRVQVEDSVQVEDRVQVEDHVSGLTATEEADSLEADAQAHVPEATRLNATVASFLLHRSAEFNVSELKTPRPFFEIKEWLLHAWKYNPQVHGTYRTQLLELGMYARQPDVADFDRAMADCRRRFVRDEAGRSAFVTPLPDDPEDQVENIQEWLMMHVCRNAETLMMDDLINMQAAALRVKKVRDQAAIDTFHERKAKFFALVFYAFGGRV